MVNNIMLFFRAVNRALLFFIFLSIAGCGFLSKIKNLGQYPEFSSIRINHNQPDSTAETQQEQEQEEYISKNNSLWTPGSKSFLHIHKTWKTGDILKVKVIIQDKASLNNTTNENRKGKDQSAIVNIVGKSRLNPLFDINSDSGYTGSGRINRKEEINIEVAAIVQQVLPNGNLVILGSQEVRVNYELREVKVAGIVRPVDISFDNSIKSDQIAEARISYGGRGNLSEAQQKKLGRQILDLLPF